MSSSGREIKYEDERCQHFNNSLDEDGVIVIASIPFRRSRILFELDIEAYKLSLNEYLDQTYEELKEIIYKNYPACIAFNFRLSEKGEGAIDPVRKLSYLKDSWESIIFVIYALVMGEVRYKNSNLKASQVFVSYDPNGNPVYNNFNTDKILSDSMKQKIYNVKGIIQYSKANNLCFKCEEIEENLLDDLLQLQDIRNSISHHATPTREQAEEELKQVEPVFKEMLSKTRFLENCKILRFASYSSKCRCQIFNGYSLNREYENFKFVDHRKSYIISLGQEHMFVFWDNECFSLSPFIHFDNDTSGHESYICFYKGKKDQKYWYEPLKLRTEKTFDHLQSRFEDEKNEIIRLVVP